MSADVESIVVGAGVVGLAIARALSLKGREVLVLEQHGLIGSETSSRNSEVIHAGLYYPNGSARARFCVRGKELLYDFCRDNGVAFSNCGKLLVATSEAELPKLQAISDTAARNGVTDLTMLTAADAKAMEPNLACAAACLSPSTGVVDSHGLMVALEGHLTSNSGQVVLDTRVTGLARDSAGLFELTTISDGEESAITAKHLILSAGLHATVLGKMLHRGGGYRPPQTYPAKGHYFSLSGPSPFSRLIYPMPDGAWLGVHLTLDFAGQTKFGPDLAWIDKVDYSFEDADGARRAMFAREISRYYPGLSPDALQPGYTGIRPKIYRQGEPVPDFAIHGADNHGMPGLVALYGIESPGLTASLAIAEHVAGML